MLPILSTALTFGAILGITLGLRIGIATAIDLWPVSDYLLTKGPGICVALIISIIIFILSFMSVTFVGMCMIIAIALIGHGSSERLIFKATQILTQINPEANFEKMLNVLQSGVDILPYALS